ncbi:MAG: ABC transporter permease [Acidobacteriaceae bacterium]
MHSILLIAKREFVERVRSRVFRVTTVLVPLGIVAVLLAGHVISKKTGGLNHIAIASDNASLANITKAQLEASQHAPQTVEIISPATPAARAQLTRQLNAGKLDGFLWITQDPNQPQPKATYYTRNSSDFFSQALLKSSLSIATVRQQLISRGLSPAEAASIVKPVPITTLQLKAGRAVKTDSERNFSGIYALVFVLYGVVIFYGTDAARSVTEEKSSRIFEILLSVTPADNLLMGKLLGVGAAAMLQVAIWVGLTLVASGTEIAAQIGLHGLSSLGITLPELIFFVVFFILGFFFYSSLSSALGATANSPQEVQQFTFFIISPLVVSVLMMAYVMTNPNSITSIILSLIPPFTPIIMYLRICAQTPPWWQIGLSIALLLGAIWGMIWIAARIYRIGILMYGKRPNLPEILRWLRYS